MSLNMLLISASALAMSTGQPGLAQTVSPASESQDPPVASGQGTTRVDQTPAPADVQTGDIVVTANRTSSLASKTPITLTAISGRDLIKTGLTSSSDLSARVPSLTLSNNNGGLQITIRGVTNSETTSRGDPSAAFLVDEVYQARTQEAEVSLYDISRVEVLRGPQGTLFGRNTTAGIIHIITNQPEFRLGGSADLVVGNWDTVTATGVVNVPVSENLAIRAAVNFDMRDNYIHQGPAFTRRYDKAKENIGGRLSALYKWTSGSLTLKGDYTDMGGQPFNFIPAGNFYTASATGAPLVGVDPLYLDRSTRRKLTVNAPYTADGFRNNYTWAVSAQANQGVGPFRIYYVGSYRKFFRQEEDPRVNFTSTLTYRLEYDAVFRQNSQEVRIATDREGPLKAQVGGLYFRETIRDEFRLNQQPNSALIGTTNRTGNAPLENESYGIFGQATYSLTDALRLTGGVRYSHDTKRSPRGFTGSCTQYDCATGFTLLTNNIADFESSKVTWKVGMDYDLAARTLLFFNVSTGYKAGGFNTGCELGTQPGCTLARSALYYRPETVTSYEGGVKSSVLDNMLRFNVSAFHYDYTDIQLSQIINDCGGGIACTATTNGGKAKVTGIEFESSLFPTADDRIDLNATYLDAHFTQFFPRPGVNFANRPLSNSPRWTLSPGYTHTFDLNGRGKIDFSVRSRISAKYKLISIGTINYYPQPGFSRTDLALGYTTADGRAYVQGFLSNIENAVPVVYIQIGARSGLTTEAPRTFGVRTGFRF